MAGKVPQTMEELRTKIEYQSANGSLGLSQAVAQKIVNRLSRPLLPPLQLSTTVVLVP
jgi:hypothetical protein